MAGEEKKQLLSKKTLENVARIETKIAKTLIKFANKYSLSLKDDLFIRIIGRDEDYPAYCVYNKGVKLADVGIGEVIELNVMEQFVVSEESIQETIYRSMDKILLGFDKETKMSQLEIYIFTKQDSGKPLFYLYKDGKPHKQIKSSQIL